MWNQLLPNMPLVGSAVVNGQLSAPGWSLASYLARVSQFIWHVGLSENGCTSETVWNGILWGEMTSNRGFRGTPFFRQSHVKSYEYHDETWANQSTIISTMRASSPKHACFHGDFRHLARKAESCTVLPNNPREAEASQSCDLSFYVFLGISWHLKSCKRRKPKGTPCSNSTNKPVPRIPQHSWSFMPSDKRTHRSTSAPYFLLPCHRPVGPRYHRSSNRSRWPDRRGPRETSHTALIGHL